MEPTTPLVAYEPIEAVPAAVLTADFVENAREASEFLKALAHHGRLVILCQLAEGEKSVGEIEELLGLRQSAVSQQLARLKADRLVETRREGKHIFYRLARPEARDVIYALHRAFCRTGVA